MFLKLISDSKELNLFWSLTRFCVGILTGDEVYVKAVDPTNGAATNMYGASDEVYSTFSGYMVAPVYEEFPSVVG